MRKENRFTTLGEKLHSPKKSLGQNFLQDKNILRKIADSAKIKDHETVIEIGPGRGALTEFLVEKTNRLKAIELDKDLLENLKVTYPAAEFIHKDFLDIELSSLFSGEKLVVIGNIPYYITTPIIFKLLENWRFVDRAILMIQDEVAKRLNAKPETKEYGILAVQLQSFSKVSYLFQVGRKAFYPIPNVESAVVELKFEPNQAIQEREVDEIFFRRLIRDAFSMRRKTLHNNLKGRYNLEVFKESCNFNDQINLNRRAETLSCDEFIALSKVLKDN